jgi:hypothetical protein
MLMDQMEYPLGGDWIFTHVSPWVVGIHAELPVKSFICALLQLVGIHLSCHEDELLM